MARSRLHPIRTALVLGGASDIAAASIAGLAAQGLERCVLAARDPDAATRVVTRTLESLAGLQPELQTDAVDVVAVAWDSLDTANHTDFFERLVGEFGPIDVVICAVGMLGHHAGITMGPDDIDVMTRTNFVGPAAAISALAPLLVDQGHGTIVVLSSVAAARARRSNYVYGSAKAGLDTFAQGLGDALHDTGVNVVVVRPGFVRTKMTEGLDPAPFSRTAEEVATAIVRSINDERTAIVWVPGHLGPMLGLLRLAPRSVWRRIAADR